MLGLLQRMTAPPAQTLRTLQPTPSTILYTVSTRPIPKGTVTLLSSYFSILLRIAVGALTVLLIWTKWRLSCGKSTDLSRVVGAQSEEMFLGFTEFAEWRYLAPGALALLCLVFRRGYTEESLTLLHGLGVQTCTKSSTYLRTPVTQFIPTTSIQDIIIHEAFKGFEVRFYLAIIVKGEKDVVVVFPTLLPRQAILEEVWRGARACLWEDMGEQKAVKRKDTVS